MSVTLLHGDCLDLLPTLPSQSVDLVLSDWPYGTTACAWDSVIPLDRLWPEIKRVLTPRGAVVLTASQPFTSALVMSNPKWFKYALVWDKRLSSGALNANVMPLKVHEDILVFAPASTTYNKQYRQGPPRVDRPSPKPNGDIRRDKRAVLRGYANTAGLYNPVSILTISNAVRRGKMHPTQKPLALFEYLMRTYSNPGDVVLDNAFGSCTTGEAAIRLGRAFIGMERDPGYYAIGAARCAAAPAAPVQAALLEAPPCR